MATKDITFQVRSDEQMMFLLKLVDVNQIETKRRNVNVRHKIWQGIAEKLNRLAANGAEKDAAGWKRCFRNWCISVGDEYRSRMEELIRNVPHNGNYLVNVSDDEEEDENGEIFEEAYKYNPIESQKQLLNQLILKQKSTADDRFYISRSSYKRIEILGNKAIKTATAFTFAGNASAKVPKHILQLSSEEKRAFLDSFDLVLTDIDGVLWNLRTAIEGAPEGYTALQNASKTVSCITNNSVRPVDLYKKEFEKLNMHLDVKNLWHPASNVVKYLKGINFEGLIYVIGSEHFKDILREGGFEIIDGPNVIIEESFRALAGQIFDTHSVRAVIIDFDMNLNSLKMMRAHLYLRNPDCLFIAGATDKFLPVDTNVRLLGPGTFTKVLEDSTENELITLGKPGAALAKLIKKEYQIKDPRRALMIGDMLEQDIGFGSECGFQTLLVLSGGCKLQDLLAETNPRLVPDYYADSMGDFVELLSDVKKAKV